MNNKQCPNCGAFNNEDTLFCTNCGNKFETQQSQPVDQPVQQQSTQPYEQPMQQPYEQQQYQNPEQQIVYQQQPYNDFNQQYPQNNTYQTTVIAPIPTVAKVFSIISFASGILSLCFCWYLVFPIIAGVVGIVFSIIAKKKMGENVSVGKFATFTKLGLIFGIIGASIGLIATIIWIIVLAAAAAVVPDLSYNYYY